MRTEEFLEGLQSRLDHPALVTRLGALDQLAAVLRQGDASAAEEQAEDASEGAASVAFDRPQTRGLARVLAEARLLQLYHEPKWVLALDSTIAAAVLSGAVPSFAQAAVAFVAAAFASHADVKSLVTLSSILGLVVRTAAAADALQQPSDWLGRAIETQAAILDSVAAAGLRGATRASSSAIYRAIMAGSAMPKLYLDVLLALPGAAGAAALGVVVSFYLRRRMSEWSAEGGPKTAVLDLYLREGLQAKAGQQLPPHRLAGFNPLVASLSEANFASTVQPALEKALKKNPDSALPATAEICGQVVVDLSAYVEPLFLPPLLRQLRSQKDDVRNLALAAVARLLAHCADPAVVAFTATELSAVVAGKSGVLAQWYQRQCLLAALRAAAARAKELGGSSEHIAAAAPAVESALVVAIEKESHESTRALGLRCLSDWVILAGDWPADAVSLFRKGVENASKPVASAYLAAVAELSVAGGLYGGAAAELLPGLAKKAVEGSRRIAAQQIDAVFAGAAVLEAAVMHPEAPGAAAAVAQVPWEALADPGSAFYSGSWFGGGTSAMAAIAQATADESGAAGLVSLCRLLKCGVELHGASVFLKPMPAPGGGPATSAPALMLVMCAMASSEGVAHAAGTAIAAVLSAAAKSTTEAASLADVLLAALRWTLHGIAGEGGTGAALSSGGSAGADEEAAAASAAVTRGYPPPSRMRKALLYILGDEVPASCFPTVLLLAHHPLVAHSARGAARLWAHSVKCFGSAAAPSAPKGGTATLAVNAGVLSATTDALLHALCGSDVGERTAALWAVPSLAGRCGEVGKQCAAASLLPGIAAAVPSQALAALTADELAIHALPDGTAHGVPVVQEQKQPDKAGASEKGAVRRGKNKEDAEWEEQVRKELEAKKKAKARGGATADGGRANGEMDPTAVALAKLLADESATRRRVEELRVRAVATLSAAEAAFAVCAEFGPAAVEYLLPKLRPLLAVSLVRSEVVSCMVTLFRCLDAPLHGAGAVVAAGALAALELLTPAAAASSGLVSACLTRVAHAVVPEYGEESALTPAGFLVVLPLLCMVLKHPKNQADCERALHLVAAHAEDDSADDILDEENVDPDGEAGKRGASGDQAEQESTRPLPPALLRGIRLPLIEAALAALERFPRAEPATDVVLAELCAGAPLRTEEWTPLLGDAGLLSDEAHVRKACLTAMLMASMQGQRLDVDVPLLESRLWLTCSDEDDSNRKLAEDLWAERDSPLNADFAPPLLALLGHSKSRVRQAAGRALAAASVALPGSATGTLEALRALYHARAPRPRRPKKTKKGPGGRGGAAGVASPELDMAKFFAAPVGMESVEEEFVDSGWVERSGVARALEALGTSHALDDPACNSTSDAPVLELFSLVATEGLADYNDTVRAQMLAAGTATISSYSGDRAGDFLRVCDAVVEAPFKDIDGASAADADVQCFDWRREGVVVLTGSAAAHLAEDDPRAGSIADTLMAALSTPSEAVQRAVAGCLEKLVKRAAVKVRGPELLKRLLTTCTTGETYGARRGAAFGLAAAVKGLGIAVLKREGVMASLEENCRGAAYQQRQGALCAFECMCERLGLLFEPYIIVILPLLLRCSSDASPHVREAANDCARAIMANLSAHGVKLVVPAILASLSDPAWRTKQAAIQLLGAMAYCAPRQLAACLPQVVPRLGEALADTHPKVRESGRKALEDIGSVIRNPEIGRLSMTLMSALSDPAKHSRAALEALLACEFLHSIDAPSLALLVPVLQRGLRDRSADLKRKAALITGNTVTMVSDPADLTPYLPALLPGLKSAALDPIPDVRATSGKALGLLVRGMGEARIGGDLIPWLTDALKADSSTSERSGAAQALSEVLSALGSARAIATLKELLPLAAGHPRPTVREGVLWTLAFLPAALGRDFAPVIDEALPAILTGLADESEPVRDVALRAGQALVATHGAAHAGQLLPALESGLFNDNWRIRQSSVQLLGDLLCLLGDTRRGEGGVPTGLDEGDDEDGPSARGSARANAAVEAALGKERRDAVLASLYLVRSDTSAVVRQGALQVWKALVPHTARALREVLPALLQHILRLLASGKEERRVVGGRALGDLVRRLGDDVLPEAVPHLRRGLAEGDEAVRQGVCLGLAEVFESATRRQLEHFLAVLVPAVQEALCDPSADVREQAAQAFQQLYRVVGAQAVEQVVPALLRQLALAEDTEGREGPGGMAEDPDVGGDVADARQRAVYGFKEVVQLRPRELLPYVVPKLVARPITVAHARALAAAAEVTGATIHYYLNVILPALLAELAATDDGTGPPSGSGCGTAGGRAAAVRAAAVAVVSSVEEVGVNWLCSEFTSRMAQDDGRQRAWATWMLEQFLLGTKADFDPQVPMLLKELMMRLADPEPAVLKATLAALRALNTREAPDKLVAHLSFCRNVLASVVSDARHRRGGAPVSFAGATPEEFLLPGLNEPRGLEPLLPMYQQGLMYGSPEVREVAAAGLGELVELTSAKSLQPLVIKITGPLIRIVGDRFPPPVKAAILHTLSILLGKGGVALKPFVPQLQTTFVKALSDASGTVRSRGATALRKLMALGPRVDPLISELAAGAAAAASGSRTGGPLGGDAAVTVTMLDALGGVFEAAGARAGQAATAQCAATLAPLLGSDDETVRTSAAKALGLALAHMPEDEGVSALDSSVLGTASCSPDARHGSVLALKTAFKANGSLAIGRGKGALTLAAECARDERSSVRAAGCELAGQSVASVAEKNDVLAARLFTGASGTLADALGDADPKVVEAAARAIKVASKRFPGGAPAQAPKLAPPLLRVAKNSSGVPKASAERALLYLLTPEALVELAAADAESGRAAKDLARRVLVRLARDSDDE